MLLLLPLPWLGSAAGLHLRRQPPTARAPLPTVLRHHMLRHATQPFPGGCTHGCACGRQPVVPRVPARARQHPQQLRAARQGQQAPRRRRLGAPCERTQRDRGGGDATAWGPAAAADAVAADARGGVGPGSSSSGGVRATQPCLPMKPLQHQLLLLLLQRPCSCADVCQGGRQGNARLHSSLAAACCRRVISSHCSRVWGCRPRCPGRLLIVCQAVLNEGGWGV